MLNRLLKYKLIITLVFMGFRMDAQQPVATATLDTNVMLIGDQVNLLLQFTGPAGSQVLWPSIPDTILENILVIDRSNIDTLNDNGKQTATLSQNILLTSFDTGFYVIPPIPFYFRVLPDTTIRISETRTHFLAVHTLAVDTTKPIKPIKGPRKVPLTLWEILRWILIGILVLALVSFGIYVYKKRRNKEPVFRLWQRIQLKPHETALQELEKLRILKLWQQGKVKEYHSELTEILRRYIEFRFAVPALESTSAQILHDMLEMPEVKSESWELLGQVLMLADMVKFAKENPSPVKNEESLENGIQFVNQTAFIEAQGTEQRAQGSEYRAQGTEQRAPGKEIRPKDPNPVI